MTWSALGASVIGTSHRARNIPCQDAFGFHTFGSAAEWLVMVAADGAGSASHSDIGARLVCHEFVRRVEGLAPDILSTYKGMRALFADVRTALLTEAERLNVRPREMACTALLAVVGPMFATLAQLGDGALVTGRGEGRERRVVFWPEPAEYVNATDFLTDDQCADFIRMEMITDPVVEVAALTDGLQRLALDFTNRTPYQPFFCPLFKELRTVADPSTLAEPFHEFLDSDPVNERTDDDKTLILAVRRL